MASLDRFAVVRVGYDRNIELNVAQGNTELVDFAEDARNAAKKKGNGGRNEQSKTAQKIEFKCHTCKALNELVINEEVERE